MVYHKASRYFTLLALIVVLLGTDGLVVLAQRKAKTRPAAPDPKGVQKPQGTEGELQDYARKFIDLYFTKCGGDSLYSYTYALGRRHLLETKDLRIEVSPFHTDPASFEVSKADRLNGIEGQGILYIEPEAYRTYDFSNNMWSEWKEGRVNIDHPSLVAIVHTIYWVMEKRKDAWSIGTSLPNRNYLTNTKVKVNCDTITGPLPVWEESLDHAMWRVL